MAIYPAQVEEYRVAEAVDQLIGSFQDIFGKRWYPPQDVFNTLVVGLKGLLDAPEKPAIAYELKLKEWSTACKPFVECVFESLTSPEPV